MQQIWKYELLTTDTQTIKMPIDAEILTVQIQKGNPYIWVLVNPVMDVEERDIEIYGIGNYITHDNRKYIGTYQTQGALVFHVFEKI